MIQLVCWREIYYKEVMSVCNANSLVIVINKILLSIVRLAL